MNYRYGRRLRQEYASKLAEKDAEITNLKREVADLCETIQKMELDRDYTFTYHGEIGAGRLKVSANSRGMLRFWQQLIETHNRNIDRKALRGE